MRLIDADNISNNKILVVKDSNSLEVIEKIMDIIKEAPTVETAIGCKDCKYCKYSLCIMFDGITYKDFYCAYSKKINEDK